MRDFWQWDNPVGCTEVGKHCLLILIRKFFFMSNLDLHCCNLLPLLIFSTGHRHHIYSLLLFV